MKSSMEFVRDHMMEKEGPRKKALGQIASFVGYWKKLDFSMQANVLEVLGYELGDMEGKDQGDPTLASALNEYFRRGQVRHSLPEIHKWAMGLMHLKEGRHTCSSIINSLTVFPPVVIERNNKEYENGGKLHRFWLDDNRTNSKKYTLFIRIGNFSGSSIEVSAYEGHIEKCGYRDCRDDAYTLCYDVKFAYLEENDEYVRESRASEFPHALVTPYNDWDKKEYPGIEKEERYLHRLEYQADDSDIHFYSLQRRFSWVLRDCYFSFKGEDDGRLFSTLEEEFGMDLSSYTKVEPLDVIRGFLEDKGFYAVNAQEGTERLMENVEDILSEARWEESVFISAKEYDKNPPKTKEDNGQQGD